MNILELIKKIFSSNKKTATIYATTLKKKYNEKQALEFALYDDKTAITNTKVGIEINGKKYIRTTDNDGVAKLDINLPVGVYDAKLYFPGSSIYNKTTAYVEVIITTDTYMDGINLTKNEGDSTPYQCALYRSDNGEKIKSLINIIINGRTYTREANNDGLYTLSINLPEGEYNIKAIFPGTELFNPSSVENTITIQPKPPEPTPEPEQPSTELYEYFTNQGGGYLGQKTGYTCACHSLVQCFHRLTGEDVSEMTLASVCGTTTDGTDHDGINTGVAWFNREYNQDIKIDWFNFSELGNNQDERFNKVQEMINNGAVFFHLLYRNQWGHYEVIKEAWDDPLVILNSLGDSCGDGYCGYIEYRNRSEQVSYINGISQKSVAYLHR